MRSLEAKMRVLVNYAAINVVCYALVGVSFYFVWTLCTTKIALMRTFVYQTWHDILSPTLIPLLSLNCI